MTATSTTSRSFDPSRPCATDPGVYLLAGVGMPYSLRPPVADMQTAPSSAPSAPSAPSARRRAHVASFLCVVLGVALVLPSLTAGFFLDDYLQIAQLEGWSRVPAHPLDLFAFTPRDRGATDRLREAGVAPYFTAPGLRLAFLRPLSSALIWFDHALFGRLPGSDRSSARRAARGSRACPRPRGWSAVVLA